MIHHYHHIVQLAAGINPALNRKEFLMQQAMQHVLDHLADLVNLDADSAQQALHDLDTYSWMYTGQSLKQLLSTFNQGIVDLGMVDAGKLLIRKGVTITGQPIRMDLVNRLTDHTVKNLQYIADDMKAGLATQLKQGYSLGESIPKLSNRVKDVLDLSKVKATRDARTMTNEVYNQAHMARYIDSNIPGVQFSAAQGENTCEICGDELDGTVWAIDDPDIVRPPVHPNCRCRLIPWLDALPSDAGQVDSDAMDFYQNFRDKYFPVPLYA